MRRRMFLGKIHRAVITHADLDYEGSCTIDADLLEAAGMLEHEELHVWNVTRGTRLVTYTLAGPRGSGVICINGAAAHHNRPGELVILATFGEMEDAEARQHVPRVVRVDAQNRYLGDEAERPGPQMPLHHDRVHRQVPASNSQGLPLP
jgi:aspartate 1-decarboxylase